MRKLFAILTLLAAPLAAQSLTTIRDTIHNPDGTLFTGKLVISWPAFQPAVGNSMAAGSTVIEVYNGYLSAVLVPTKNADPPVAYTVDYDTQTGTILRTEFWDIPPSLNILTRDKLYTNLNNLPTSVGNPIPASSPPPVILAGLPLFADAEKPVGVADGTNLVFTLAAVPNPTTSLMLFRNGLLQSIGIDYSLNGATITFIPVIGEPSARYDLIAWYRH